MNPFVPSSRPKGDSDATVTPDSPFPEYMDAQRGAKKRTHRGRRSRGKGPAVPASSGPADHHAVAKEHIEAAMDAPNPKAATAHLFKALSSLKKC